MDGGSSPGSLDALASGGDAASGACTGPMGACVGSGSDAAPGPDAAAGSDAGASLSWQQFSSEGIAASPLSTTKSLLFEGARPSGGGGALRNWGFVRNDDVYMPGSTQGGGSASFAFDPPTVTWSAIVPQTYSIHLTTPIIFDDTLYSTAPPEAPRRYEAFLVPQVPLFIFHEKASNTWKDLSGDAPVLDASRGIVWYEAGDRMVFALIEPLQMLNAVDYVRGVSGPVVPGNRAEVAETRYDQAIAVGQDRIAVLGGVSMPVNVSLSNAHDLEKTLFVRDGWVYDFASKTYHALPPVPDDSVYNVVYAQPLICFAKHFIVAENPNGNSPAYILDLNAATFGWVRANSTFSVCTTGSLSTLSGAPAVLQIFDIEANVSSTFAFPAGMPTDASPIPNEDGDKWVVAPMGTFSGGYVSVTTRTWTSFPVPPLPSIGPSLAYLLVVATRDHLVMWGQAQSISDMTTGCPIPGQATCDPAVSWSATVSPVGMMIGLP
jgi:hypothetical protein